ncbi:MAG: MTH1187 family thiamine-binding protein [Spirochaetales bacterium]|nr:MTH1187 family thiamine-binding protein [Spirochaetales bacterium]
MAIMEISIVPVGTKDASVSRYVAGTLKVLEHEKGISYTLNPMGTVVEAESLAKIFEIAARMHDSVFNDEVTRVVTTIKIDERRDKRVTMLGKIKAVEDKLNV